jgi:hypothetical protein
MESARKELRVAAESSYAKGPPKAMLSMYGGSAEDYLPDIEVSSATIDVFRVFSDLGSQWRVDGASGYVNGLDYSAIPFVLSCHGIEPGPQILRDLKVMEAAAAAMMNMKEES